MSRTRAERRHNDWKKAIRKKKISDEVYWSEPGATWSWYNNLHQYSKNKIHCSCAMCATKTNNKGKYAYYGGIMNWSIRDRRQLDEMDYDDEEFDFIYKL